MEVRIIDVHPDSAWYEDRSKFFDGKIVDILDSDSIDSDGWYHGNFKLANGTYYAAGLKYEEAYPSLESITSPEDQHESLIKAAGKIMMDNAAKTSINIAADILNKAQGDRYNTGKPKLSFNSLSKEVNEGEAAVWEAGSKKYARGNWLKGAPLSACADSVLRHLQALLAGEDLDPESGLPHADHIVCSAKILSHSFHTRKDLDDRETIDPYDDDPVYILGDTAGAVEYTNDNGKRVRTDGYVDPRGCFLAEPDGDASARLQVTDISGDDDEAIVKVGC